MVVPDPKESVMAKYLLLKYYRGGPEPVGEMLTGATADEMKAHTDHMSTLNDELTLALESFEAAVGPVAFLVNKKEIVIIEINIGM